MKRNAASLKKSVKLNSPALRRKKRLASSLRCPTLNLVTNNSAKMRFKQSRPVRDLLTRNTWLATHSLTPTTRETLVLSLLSGGSSPTRTCSQQSTIVRLLKTLFWKCRTFKVKLVPTTILLESNGADSTLSNCVQLSLINLIRFALTL